MRSRVAAAALAVAVFLAGPAGPAAGQPFSDVPANHWAYDALARLAAKGLIEGYPDGAFRGDRAMTRYEMAVAVARLLARLESLRIPAPAGAAAPPVTQADVNDARRLADEFRPELTALGVRVTTIEEELNAIKAKLDNVRITGALRFRYDIARNATGGPVNGNANTGAVDAGQSPQLGLASQALKLSFDGAVAPDVHLIAALISYGTSSGAFAAFNSSALGGAPGWQLAAVDNAFFDWRNAFGLPLEIWLGRFGGTELETTYPVQFGPFGLLMNTGGATWEDSTGDSGFNVADGLRLAGEIKRFADVQWQAVVIRVAGGTGGTTYASGEDAYGVDANIAVNDSLRVGGYYVGNNIVLPGAPVTGATNALWHVYGPGGGAMNPATANCPAVAGLGIQCPAAGSGEGGYLDWDAAPGIHLDGEAAQWNDAVHGTSDLGYQVNTIWNLGTLLAAGHDLSLQTGYLYYGANFYPPYGAAEADNGFQEPAALVSGTMQNDTIYPGNAQAVAATLSFSPAAAWTVYGTWVGGSSVSNGQGFSEYEAGAQWAFARTASIVFLARSLTINGVQQLLLYRAQLDYTF